MKRSSACGLLLAAGLLTPGPAPAQEYSLVEDSSVLGRNTGIPHGTPGQGPTAVGDVDLVVESAIFAENLEALGPVKGETFIGFLAPLRLRYRPSEPVVFELGAVLGQNFGDDDALDDVDPLLRLVYEPRSQVFLVAGTLFPTHWMHDALLDDVQKLRQVSEQGFQLRVDRPRLKHDSWINWRVRETSFQPEKFEWGTTTELRLLDERLRLEGHFLWDHVGGQINLSDRVEHNRSALAGASWGFPRPLGVAAVDELRLGARYLHSTEDPELGTLSHGRGWEAFTRLELRPWQRLRLRVEGSHFDGQGLLARRGDPRYGLAELSQLGVHAVLDVGAGLRLEAGGVVQHSRGDTQGSFLVSFVWGQSFALGFLEPRSRRPERPPES